MTDYQSGHYGRGAWLACPLCDTEVLFSPDGRFAEDHPRERCSECGILLGVAVDDYSPDPSEHYAYANDLEDYPFELAHPRALLAAVMVAFGVRA